MYIEISESELQTRQKNGRTIICRSCKDSRGKIVLMWYNRNENPSLEYGFCQECLKLMGHCIPCASKKKSG